MKVPRPATLLIAAAFGCASAKTGIPMLDSYPRDVTGTTQIIWYDVHGRTAAELSADMHKEGPKNNNGSWVGETRTPMRWTYRTHQDGLICSISETRIFVDSRITLPRWTPPPDAEPGLAEEWQRFMDALERHEAGHKDISGKAAEELITRLNNLSSGCSSLGAQVSRWTIAITTKLQDDQVAYDAATMHGLTQGTVLRSQRAIAQGAPAAFGPVGQPQGAPSLVPPSLATLGARAARLGVQPDTLTVRVDSVFSLQRFVLTVYDSSGKSIATLLGFDSHVSPCGLRSAGVLIFRPTAPGLCEVTLSFPRRFWTRPDSIPAAHAVVRVLP